MKNKKGFTLIELLAIIVILAIIAVITVPIILSIIENSKNGAVTNSAYGYKDGLEKYYLSKTVDNSELESPTAVFDISNLPTDFKVNGEEPTEGWVELEKGKVIAYSLKFGDYVVTLDSDTKVVSTVKNGELAANSALVTVEVVKAGISLATGDTVKLCWDESNVEEFYVLLNDPLAPSGSTALLAKNNINPATGFQGANNTTYGVRFATAEYWHTSGKSYPSNVYVSTMDDASGNNYSVAYYVNTYVRNLHDLGFNVDSGRILSTSEVDSGGIAASYRYTGEMYWLSTAISQSKVSAIPSSGIDYRYVDENYYGVTPVIYIKSSDLN